MKSYYWLIVTLLVLSFGVFHLFFDRVHNLECYYKTDKPLVGFIDKKVTDMTMNGTLIATNKIQKKSLLSIYLINGKL